jgi:alkylation response protein AidB-like acyl-CoA dehydrogenase
MNAVALEHDLTHNALTQLSEEEELFRSSVREFAEGEVRPRVEQMEHEAKLDKDLIKQCFELGLMAIETPEEYGGAGSSFFNAILAIEELARVDASTSVFVDVQNTLVTNAIIRWGNSDLKKKYLPQMAESKVGAYALSEAGSGSDAFALKTKAVDKGNFWEISGQKLWITTATKPKFLSSLRRLTQAAGYKGITAFIVEKDFEGFSVGKKEDKLGIRASSTTELILDSCKVPKENVLGEVGKGLQSFNRNLKRRQNRNRRANDRNRARRI